MPSDGPADFWEDPARVEQFAAREPDLRLRARIDGDRRPGDLRCLDLGCAGGRNTEFLAARGVVVYSIDASKAMVERTRTRLAPYLAPGDVGARLRRCRMDELDWLPDDFFSLVVAFGVLHHAGDVDEWGRTMEGLVRVLQPAGELMVSVFTPQTRIGGHRAPEPVAGARHVFDCPALGRCRLLDDEALDRELEPWGFEPMVATTIVRRKSGSSLRVTANGHYRLTA